MAITLTSRAIVGAVVIAAAVALTCAVGGAQGAGP
jgi:hypothetical protein